MGVAPIVCRKKKIPWVCQGGRSARNVQPGKVKMQAGLGWEVCRALIPLHRGTDFNKAGSLRGDAG